MKRAWIVLPFFLVSSAWAEGAAAIPPVVSPASAGIGIAPTMVPDPETMQAIPRADLPDELAKDFDARVSSILNILSAEKEKGALNPEQYKEDVALVNQVIEGERRLQTAQNGTLSADQLDELNHQLEQVEEQIQQTFVE